MYSYGSGTSQRDLVRALRRRGVVSSPAVAAALSAIDRQYYVPRVFVEAAYVDKPLPIGFNATISAPHMHAMAIELLRRTLASRFSLPPPLVSSQSAALSPSHAPFLSPFRPVQRPWAPAPPSWTSAPAPATSAAPWQPSSRPQSFPPSHTPPLPPTQPPTPTPPPPLPRRLTGVRSARG
jgi:hypothetical protein